MTTEDPNRSLQRAGDEFARGDLASARLRVVQILRDYPDAPAALHLLALIEKRRGAVAEARRAFEAAMRAAPNDPQIRNNLANLLNDIGETQQAVEHYQRAVALAPGYVDAWINLGLALQRLGQWEAAEAALRQATDRAPQQARPWLTLGLLHRELGDSPAAIAAVDRALALAPTSSRALHARGELDLERGQPAEAAGWLRKARAVDPTRAELLVREAVAQHELDDSGAAERLLEECVRMQPDFVKAHTALAQLRWEMGEDAARFTRSFDETLAQQPQNLELWSAYLNALTNAKAPQRVIEAVAAARSKVGPQLIFDLAEAVANSDLGQDGRARELFTLAILPGDLSPGPNIAFVRHLLRTGAVDEAAGRIARVAEAWPRHQLIWAYVGTTWRLLGDPRYDWLERAEGLTAAIDLELEPDLLGRLAEVLRGLHRAKRHPLDQTLRGGTQTQGSLFTRGELEIVRLREAIRAAVRRYIDALPPADPAHPLLGLPRDQPVYFAGSWSVRLQSQGFHVNHVHPAGWISSAFYVALPPRPAGSTDGWLALGEPPAELRLDLAPFRLIEPKPGRLALFPSYMWHGTRPFEAGERLTVAFDVRPPGEGA